MLASRAISYRSGRQSLVTSSTMEAEYVAYFEASPQAIWLKNWINKLKIVDSISKLIRFTMTMKPS